MKEHFMPHKPQDQIVAGLGVGLSAAPRISNVLKVEVLLDHALLKTEPF
jgi:hypothetical protein